MARLEARRIDEDELGIRSREDARDTVPRRLGLLRRDADALADQAVDERRLADVGTSDDRYVTAPKLACAVSHVPRPPVPPSPWHRRSQPLPAPPRAGSCPYPQRRAKAQRCGTRP